MSTGAPGRPFGGLIDRRLSARVTATRRFLVTAVVVGLLATVCVVAQAVLLATVIERSLLHHASLGSVAPFLVGLAAAFAGRALCGWIGEAAAQRTSARVTSVLRRQLVEKAVGLGPAWLAGERTGELTSATTRGIAELNVYFGRFLPQAVLAATAPIGVLAWIGWEDWPSLLILGFLVLLVPVAMVVFGRRAQAETERRWRSLSTLSARFLEILQGLATLRSLGQTRSARRDLAASTEALRQTTMATLRVSFLSALAMEFLAGIGTGLVAMVLGLRLLDGRVSLFSALAVLLVSPEVFVPLRRAGAEFHASTDGQAAAQRILGLLDEETAAAPGPAKVQIAPPPDPRRGPLVLSGVGFRYPSRDVAVLDGLDLTVAPGEHVAVVGPSGSGKSTLLSLLLAFVAPVSGSIRVGGTDLSAVDPAAWRRQVAWVPQEPRLLSATLGENVALGDPEADEARLRSVSEAAGLSHLLAGLPEGLATPIGEGGLRLSAGERQRVGLARALLRDAPLVILDEPVAHLDEMSERQLADELAGWFERRSVVVAAHRPSLVRRVDTVIRLGPASGEERTTELADWVLR